MLPHVNRMLLGFYEQNYNGRRIVGHGGDTQWFHSKLHLYIDDNVGLYVSINSAGKEGAIGRHPRSAVRAVHRTLLPGAVADGRSLRRRPSSTRSMMAGLYDKSRASGVEFLQPPELARTHPGRRQRGRHDRRSAATDLAGTPIKWREVEPFVWREWMVRTCSPRK